MPRALPNKRRLTEGFVRKPGPKQETSFLVWGEYTRGLTVRVEPTGAKSWMVYYRSSGKAAVVPNRQRIIDRAP